MAYRFNGGNGAVTCDVCNVIFDENLSPAEYEEWYGGAPDHCWEHKNGKKEETNPDNKE